MRIAILSGRHVWGGAEEQARMLSGALGRGHEVVLITTGAEDQEFDEGNHRRITLRLPRRAYFWHNYWNGTVVRRLGRVFERIRPDILHFHNVHNRTLSAASLLFSREIPSVWTLHDLWSQCIWSTPRPRGCEGTSHGCLACRCMPVLSIADRKIKEAVFRRSPMTLVLVCEWLRRRISTGVLATKSMEVIHSGVETGRFEGVTGRAMREKLGIPEDARVVLFAGTMLTNVKGHEDLLRAARRILATEHDVWFVLVGAHGRSPLRHRQVIFVGRVEPAEMPGYYAAADVFAYPTHGDIFPLVVLEALASAKPVVTHRIGGLSELVEDGTSGFLVEEHDEDALEERLRRLIADRELAKSMGETGRERVRGFFTVEQQVRKTEALYDKVVKGNRKV